MPFHSLKAKTSQTLDPTLVITLRGSTIILIFWSYCPKYLLGMAWTAALYQRWIQCLNCKCAKQTLKTDSEAITKTKFTEHHNYSVSGDVWWPENKLPETSAATFWKWNKLSHNNKEARKSMMGKLGPGQTDVDPGLTTGVQFDHVKAFSWWFLSDVSVDKLWSMFVQC